MIKIYRTDLQGKEQILNVLVSGQMFPHQGFFRKGNYPAHAQAVEKSQLIYIPIHSFEEFLMKNPQVCIKIFRILARLLSGDRDALLAQQNDCLLQIALGFGQACLQSIIGAPVLSRSSFT